jgi:hypothetical protein
MLRPLPGPELRARLEAAQPYAASQPGWPRFVAGLERCGGFELCRGRHPLESAAALHDLLAAS